MNFDYLAQLTKIKIYRYLKNHELYVYNLQAIFLFKLPIQFILILLISNLVFGVIYKMRVGFYATLAILAIFYKLIYWLFQKSQFLFNFFFDDEIIYDTEKNSDRIRTPKEIAEFWHPIIQTISRISIEPNQGSIYKQILLTLILFIIAYFISSIKFYYIFFHILLFLPGIIMNPFINSSFSEAYNKVFSQ